MPPNWISWGCKLEQGGGRAKVRAPYDGPHSIFSLKNTRVSKHLPRRSIFYASVRFRIVETVHYNHSFTRGVSSFHAWRALLARRLSVASRPLATGPSMRWTAADHLQRLSSIGRAGRRSATPWHGWPWSRVADHPCRHPCRACLKQRLAANGIITFLESSRGSTALLWRLYATELVPGLYSGELNLNGQTRE
ncbi:hypothetical protein GGI35DRAFT_343620 [Trichoderma velutinum]